MFKWLQGKRDPVWQDTRPEEALKGDDPGDTSESSRARSISQLAFQQRSVLDELEQITNDPDQLLSLFRIRNLVAKINFQAEFLQMQAGHSLPALHTHAVKASAVARDATEACSVFENVRIEVRKDSYLKPSIANGVASLLTQLLNRALDAERFGIVHLVVSMDGGLAQFEVIDHARGFDAKILRQVEGRIAGQGGQPSVGDSLEEAVWAVGHLANQLPIGLDFDFNSDAAGTTAILTVGPAGMDTAENAGPEQAARPSATAMGWGPRQAKAEARPYDGTSPAAPAPISTMARQKPPPLYQAALEKMERRARIKAVEDRKDDTAAHRLRPVTLRAAPELQSTRYSERRA